MRDYGPRYTNNTNNTQYTEERDLSLFKILNKASKIRGVGVQQQGVCIVLSFEIWTQNSRRWLSL